MAAEGSNRASFKVAARNAHTAPRPRDESIERLYYGPTHRPLAAGPAPLALALQYQSQGLGQRVSQPRPSLQLRQRSANG